MSVSLFLPNPFTELWHGIVYVANAVAPAAAVTAAGVGVVVGGYFVVRGIARWASRNSEAKRQAWEARQVLVKSSKNAKVETTAKPEADKTSTIDRRVEESNPEYKRLQEEIERLRSERDDLKAQRDTAVNIIEDYVEKTKQEGSGEKRAQPYISVGNVGKKEDIAPSSSVEKEKGHTEKPK